jgi:hypothetical protein
MHTAKRKTAIVTMTAPIFGIALFIISPPKIQINACFQTHQKPESFK